MALVGLVPVGYPGRNRRHEEIDEQCPRTNVTARAVPGLDDIVYLLARRYLGPAGLVLVLAASVGRLAGLPAPQ